MKFRLEDMCQRDFEFAIVDEVDSILIDEARTPLIISGPAEDSSDLYRNVNELIPALSDTDYEKDEKQGGQEINFYIINHSGIHSLNLNWQPDDCYELGLSRDGYDSSESIFVVYDYFYCVDTIGGSWTDSYFWNPSDNSTVEIPNDLRNSDNSPKSAISFNTGINTTQTNWLLTFSTRTTSGGNTPFDYGILWSDFDRDGVKDSIDIFPYDSSQHSDNDGDGYGDSFSGNLPDSCPSEYGNSTIDRPL